MGAGRRFILRVHHDHGKTRGLACFVIEFAGDRLGVGQEPHGPCRLDRAVDEVIALPVHGAKTRVLQCEHPVREVDDGAGVAVIVVEDPDQVGRTGPAVVLVEKPFERRPGKKVGMDNLVGVPAQDKLVRLAQGGENELQLDRSQILHLVDHHKIVAGLDQRQVLGAQDIRCRNSRSPA